MNELNSIRSIKSKPKMILMVIVLLIVIILIEADPISNYTKIEHFNNGGNFDCRSWDEILLNNGNSELRNEEIFRDKFFYHLDDCKIK